MGIFDLFKKNKAVSHGQTEEQVIKVSPQPQASIKTKGSIADFFNIDIHQINPDEYSQRIVLSEPELEMFPYVEVNAKDGIVNSIEFISHSKIFSSELRKLINRCAKTFGPTKSGESTLTAQDSVLLQRGMFSRMWPTIWFDCGPDDENGGLTAIRVTIFNPSKNGNLQLKDI